MTLQDSLLPNHFYAFPSVILRGATFIEYWYSWALLLHHSFPLTPSICSIERSWSHWHSWTLHCTTTFTPSLFSTSPIERSWSPNGGLTLLIKTDSRNFSPRNQRESKLPLIRISCFPWKTKQSHTRYTRHSLQCVVKGKTKSHWRNQPGIHSSQRTDTMQNCEHVNMSSRTSSPDIENHLSTFLGFWKQVPIWRL